MQSSAKNPTPFKGGSVKRLGWILVAIMLLSCVSAVEQPCFQNVTMKGNGSMRVYDLNWTPSPEPDVQYSLFYNYNATPIYEGSLSHYVVNVVEGKNVFGISARVFNDSEICEGIIQYNRNKPPTAPRVECPDDSDVSNSQLICNVTYDSVDPDDSELLYAFFVDDALKAADFNSQSLPVAGLSKGQHNLSICAFDGEFFSCGYDTVNFIVIPKPVFQNVYIVNPAIPFYGDMVQSYAYINVTINDTKLCNVWGKITNGDESYNITCSYSGGVYVCLVNLTYSMGSGDYDVSLTADNGAKTETYSKNNGLEVYEVFSAVVTSPVYDITQVFDGWVFSQDPVKVFNYGSIRLKRLYLKTRPIACTGASFSNLTIGSRSKLSDSYDAMDGLYFDINRDAGEWNNFNVFIYNPSRSSPKGCSSTWDVEVYANG